MKKALFILMMLLLLGIVFSYAQCGKKNVITTSQTEYINANGTVERTVDEFTTIEYDQSSITITLSNGADSKVMTGPVKSDSCNWKLPYKDGKSVIKAQISDARGDQKNLTLTIEGKDGKISLLAVVDEVSDRKIRLVADKFEEKTR